MAYVVALCWVWCYWILPILSVLKALVRVSNTAATLSPVSPPASSQTQAGVLLHRFPCISQTSTCLPTCPISDTGRCPIVFSLEPTKLSSVFSPAPSQTQAGVLSYFLWNQPNCLLSSHLPHLRCRQMSCHIFLGANQIVFCLLTCPISDAGRCPVVFSMEPTKLSSVFSPAPSQTHAGGFPWIQPNSPVFPSARLQCGTSSVNINIPSVENPQLTNVLPQKPGVGQEYSHACFAYCQEFLPCPHSAFPVHSPEFLDYAMLARCMCCYLIAEEY